MLESPTILWRPATYEDVFLLFEWANDPVVRTNSFHSEPIMLPTHLEWFERTLADPNCLLLILLEADGSPIGQARFNRTSAREAEVSIALGSEWRGRGIGARAIALSTAEASLKLKVERVHALVKAGNEPSLRAFLRAGYEEIGLTEHDGHQAVRLVRVC
jgi:RimJ/RimL family protein N-acetyltransferase